MDFGKGFYTTGLRSQAEKWVQRFLKIGSRAFVSVYEFDKESVIENCRYKRFELYDAAWLDFILSNCAGGKDFLDYDIIEGGIANDRVFNTVELYFDGLIDKAEALRRLRFEKPNNQICFISQEVLNQYLHFARADEVLYDSK